MVRLNTSGLTFLALHNFPDSVAEFLTDRFQISCPVGTVDRIDTLVLELKEGRVRDSLFPVRRFSNKAWGQVNNSVQVLDKGVLDVRQSVVHLASTL